jgi:2-polyprenyl-3-methyl-5-hydroxy-6-metoxy-1,4-benzoquinol methylase
MLKNKYEFSNEEYVSNLLKHEEKYFQILLSAIDNLKINKNATILDFGCGTGNLVAILKTKGFTNVIGIDIDQDSIEKGKEFHNIDCLFFESNYNLENKNFDVVICNDVLEHIVDVHEFLDKLVSLVNSNGILLIKTPNYLNPRQYLSYIKQKLMNSKIHITPFTDGNVLKIFARFLLSSLYTLLKLFFNNTHIIKVTPIDSSISVGGDADATWMSNYLDIKNYLKTKPIEEINMPKRLKKRISSNIYIGKRIK